MKNLRRDNFIIVRCIKGFTLMEIIVSLAILSIVIIVLLSVFTSGLKGIYVANHKTDKIFASQSQLELKIEQGTTQTNDFSITFPATGLIAAKTIKVAGEIVTTDEVYENGRVQITAFISNKN